MDESVEHELCNNCKREIPHFNYVMHTAHCQRNIVLCPLCKEPVPKIEIEEHKMECSNPQSKVDKNANKENLIKPLPQQLPSVNKKPEERKQVVFQPPPIMNRPVSNKPQQRKPPQKLIACQYCELELIEKDIGDHENYCGSRTDKCDECGELVMFKYRQIHLDSNHGFLKLDDEPGPPPSWQPKPKPLPLIERPQMNQFYYNNAFPPPAPTPLPPEPPARTGRKSGPKGSFDNTTEMMRRMDCKTEYIRNLLHETALQTTVPIRSPSTGAVPRSYKKGPAPPPPVPKTMPPTEIKIPCEFCHEMIDADDYVMHETGCRPDLTRYMPKNRGHSSMNESPSGKCGAFELASANSTEVELPCEFCSTLVPASKLLRHQALCA